VSFSRSSGILLHPTSLPGPHGIGDMGEEAYRFVDFLVSGGQSLWQVLPLGPTGYGDSPYASFSAFAGNTLLISLTRLIEDGLLSSGDLNDAPAFSTETVDFGGVVEFKQSLLRQAFDNFQRTTDSALRNNFESFCQYAASWLEDYALYRALKDEHGGVSWIEWEKPLARREAHALAEAGERLREQIEAQRFYQFLFFKQWLALKSYANERGVKLIGDIPIFVAQDSADVWTHPEQFKLNEEGIPLVVAGVPPDYFSATGQFWGNPLYHWEHMIADGFRWWIERVRATLHTIDILRIDHFRGFAACWEIPGGEQTAERGQWVDAPGRELFTAIKHALGPLPIIAEDLGVITPDVEALRDGFGFPGMRILQFAFSSDSDNQDLPHNYHQNVVVYTGTHDNDTTVGWFKSEAGQGSTRDAEQVSREKEFALKYLNSTGEEIHWDFIRAVQASVASIAVIPLQDLLGLGTSARMNLPNSTQGNWSWRYKAGDLMPQLGQRLQDLAQTYGRIRKPEAEEQSSS
jgi:4-alpha-glucanotransferase